MSSIAEELRLGTLRTLHVALLETNVPVMAIHRRQGYLSRASRLLLQMLTAQADLG